MNSVGSGAMNTSNIAGNELTQFSLGTNGSMPCWKIPKQTCLSLDCTERTRHLCISVEAASKKCKKRSYWRKPWISRHDKQGAYNNLAAELEAGGSCVTTRITKSQFGDIIGTFTPLIKPILTNANFQAVIDHNIVCYFHRRWPTSGRSRRQVLFVPIVAHLRVVARVDEVAAAVAAARRDDEGGQIITGSQPNHRTRASGTDVIAESNAHYLDGKHNRAFRRSSDDRSEETTIISTYCFDCFAWCDETKNRADVISIQRTMQARGDRGPPTKRFIIDDNEGNVPTSVTESTVNQLYKQEMQCSHSKNTRRAQTSAQAVDLAKFILLALLLLETAKLR